jgi:hypothetical protein
LPNRIRAFRPKRNPAICHFFCVQIKIDRLQGYAAIRRAGCRLACAWRARLM